MVAGAFIMGFSSILTGLNFIVTIHKLRAPGLTWSRLSLFLWSLYATSIIQVLATPVLAITLLLLIMERSVGVGVFDPKLGGDPVLFQHFFWFYSHPAVYIMILPAMGIISELIATFARKRIFGYKAVAMSSLGLALVSFIVWGHHLFVSGQSEFAAIAFSFLTFLVAIPSAIKVINWTMTLYEGSIDLQTPMLFALAFIFMFTIGGLTGIFLGVLSVDVHLHDTYFVVAHFHYVMMGGTVMGFLGGLLYWWPKMTGKMFNEKTMRVAFGLIFVGFNATFFVQFIMGARGMPRRYYNYLDQFQPFHAFSTVGTWILAAGFLVMLYALIQSLRNGAAAPGNPWHSLGLEWQSTSPPPLENFEKQPVVTHGPYDYDTVKTSLFFPSKRAARGVERQRLSPWRFAVPGTLPHPGESPPMSSSTAEADAAHGHDEHGHHGPAHLAHHFDNSDQQFESAKLGMWVFLVTEILMFGGLFAAFIIYQGLHKDLFLQAHHHLDKVMGGTNTIFLLSSSLTIALAVRASQLGKKNQTTAMLVATLLFACGFLVIKYFEYSHKIHDGLLPGPYFHAHDLPKDAHIFFSLYFMMTGLHGFHVVLGMCLISWILVRNIKGEFSSEFYTPIEIVGLYWHLVDLIWIYLFPLLYLIG
jgi:heme/copper-type cytochrome/quinol oxidase subunit 1/heme/copper-type cytochrome/quinol oxidase subunit 3